MHTPEEAKKKVKETIGSLEDLCREAVCTADVNLMLAMGFPGEAAGKICNIIRQRARELNIRDLEQHYRWCVKKRRSTLINTIVRENHPVYFATRASLHPLRLLEYLQAPPTDLCAFLVRTSLSKSTLAKRLRREVLRRRATKNTPCEEALDRDLIIV
jgi:hypothetical protein